MENKIITNEKLFSYGTLCFEKVQLTIFGRKLVGKSDILESYKLSQLQINNSDIVGISGESVHPILIFTGAISDKVEGFVFDISSNELALADKYEVLDYKRIKVNLVSGVLSWVYVSI